VLQAIGCLGRRKRGQNETLFGDGDEEAAA
jgi:hypothetical protein